MKKFTNLNETKEQKYNDVSKNEINELLETLKVKFSDDEEKYSNVDVSIEGIDEVVEKIENYINEQRYKERALTLETVRSNVYNNFSLEWLDNQIDMLNEKIK